MRDKFISIDRKKYLRKIKINKIAVFVTQVRNFTYYYINLGSFS